MNPAIDITTEQRKTLVDLLRQYIPGVAVWAYGSRVNWTARSNSDLDLVVFSAPGQLNLVSELKSALAESDLPFLVDLHVWDEIPERFREIISKKYVVVQEQRDGLTSFSRVTGWRESTWGEEISLEYGKALRGYSPDTGKYRVYGSNGPIGWHSEALAPGPGIVLGRKGAYRGIEFCREPFYVIDTAYYVVPKNEFDMRWLYYAMVYHKLGEIDDGSPIPSTTRSAVYIRELEVPPLREQRSIAAILGAIDDKIELIQKMNKTLEAMARAVFKSWFVDFDPVRAKTEGREPAGMDSETAALFPYQFEMSVRGPIPRGWRIIKIADCAQVGRGASPRPINDYMGGDVPWIKISDATSGDGTFIFETKEHIRQQGVPRSVKVGPGDLVMSNSASCGIPVFIEIHGCIHDGWLYFRDYKFITKNYLYYWLKDISAQLVHLADGSVQKNLNTALVSSQPMLIPPEPVMECFDATAAGVLAEMRNNAQTRRTLADLRDTLLPRLISGKLRVPEAEKLVGALP